MRQRTRVVLFIERGNTLEHHVVKEVVNPPDISTAPVNFVRWMTEKLYRENKATLDSLAVGEELRIIRSHKLNVLVEATDIDESSFIELLDGYIQDIDPRFAVAIRRTKYLYVVIERRA